MRRYTAWVCALILLLCLLAGCGAVTPAPLHEGETYLDGSWYLDDGILQIGYNFFPDGGGYLFIGETVVPIRYGVLGACIYVYDNAEMQEFSFASSEEGLWIGGMLYQPVADDPEVAMSVEALLSEAQQEQPQESPTSGLELLLRLVTLAAAVAIVVILFRYFKKKKQQKS